MYAESLLLVSFLADPSPKDDDVVAGPLAAAVFVFLILAVAFLGFSLVKRLRNVEKAEASGLYDPSTKKPVQPTEPPEPTEPTESTGSTESTGPSQPE